MTHIFGQLFQVTEEAKILAFCNETSSAWAEISDGPHKGGPQKGWTK